MPQEIIAFIAHFVGILITSSLLIWFVHRCIRALFNEQRREYAPYIGELRHCQRRLEDDTKRHIREAVERMDTLFADFDAKVRTLCQCIDHLNEEGARHIAVFQEEFKELRHENLCNMNSTFDEFQELEALIKRGYNYINSDIDEIEDRLMRLEYKPPAQITGPASAPIINAAHADYPPRRMRRRRGL